MTHVLTEPRWTARRAAHERTVDLLLAERTARRAEGLSHPVQDFLFTYYRHRPSRLRRWQPGLGVALTGPAAEYYLGMAGYERTGAGIGVGEQARQRRRHTAEFVAALLAATASRAPVLGCFGLHEWAMVYRSETVRHDLPLRLGRDGTDAVVESLPLRCTHHDAFRFFTPEAVGRNATSPTRAEQVATEQPGCVHTTMDLYRWAYTLEPLVSSELVLDCLRLALDARTLDMRASPYDVTGLGHSPVPVETPAGRSDYARAQAELVARAAPLRTRLLAVCEQVLRRPGGIDPGP